MWDLLGLQAHKLRHSDGSRHPFTAEGLVQEPSEMGRPHPSQQNTPCSDPCVFSPTTMGLFGGGHIKKEAGAQG